MTAMTEQGRPSVERDPSADPILARLALWLADVAGEAAQAVQRPSPRPIRPAPRTSRA